MNISEVYENIYKEVLKSDNKYLIKKLSDILFKYKIDVNGIDYKIVIDNNERCGWVLLPKEYYNYFKSYELNDFANKRFLQLLEIYNNENYTEYKQLCLVPVA